MTSRIHIIGGPGSGKSHLARKLSSDLGVPSYDLDDLFWDNTAESYGTRATPEIRDRKLQEIVQLPGWIIEGVYHQWLDESFRQADVIVVLTPWVYLRDWRILKRFTMRTLGRIEGKREAFGDLLRLMRWNHSYDGDNLKRALAVLAQHNNKVLRCGSTEQAMRMINERSQPAGGAYVAPAAGAPSAHP